MSAKDKNHPNNVVDLSNRAKVVALVGTASRRSFKALADLTDGLVERHAQILAAMRSLGYVRDADNLPDARDLELDEHDCESIARAKVLLNTFDPDDAYERDEDGEDGDGGPRLKRALVEQKVGLLLAGYLGAQPANPELFALTLAEHVLAGDFSLLALHSGFHELQTSRATPPAISAVTTALKEHEATWARRRHAVFGIANSLAMAIKMLAEARQRIAAEQRSHTLHLARNGLNMARHFLVERQNAAAKIAGEIEAGFERLARAEAALDAATASGVIKQTGKGEP